MAPCTRTRVLDRLYHPCHVLTMLRMIAVIAMLVATLLGCFIEEPAEPVVETLAPEGEPLCGEPPAPCSNAE
jgi:hypothetical protein